MHLLAFAGATVLFSLFFTVIICIAFYKVFIRKTPIDHYYTPFDHITGQTSVSFHEEKEEKEERDQDGDDRD